ncbi:MAG: PilT/PilU family type 4a pilus ATPase [Nitrospirae bacterium]|nr:PilT/PilU family type 4a pilus ATPase [Nitrospirota bacterium]
MGERERFGEVLVKQGLINKNQLKEALRRQAQKGGHLGSILVELGYLSVDELINQLSLQLTVPSVNLLNLDITPEILKILPLDKIKTLKVLPIGFDEHSVTLAMVNPNDMATISDLEFYLGKKIKPVVVPSYQLDAAINSLISSPERGINKDALAIEVRKVREKPSQIIPLLKYLVESSASDMFLTPGVPPSIKIHNELKRMNMDILSPSDCEHYARELLPQNHWEYFLTRGDHDFAVTYPEIGRFRVNLYKQRNSISITIRYVTDIIPSLKELNLPEWLKEYALKPQGLILISGPSGHGKTTTMAAMVDLINTHRSCNIVTLEDPIEYLHKHKNSNVNQREIGLDTLSFSEALRHIFRQDPDVIAIGELRDIESFEIALHAADTGHLVLATVHASNSTSTIERIVNIFPHHQQNLIRLKLADSLLLVFSQKLIPMAKSEGRIVAYEKLINSYRIKNLIREAKTHQIRSQMESGTDDFTSIDLSLATLYRLGEITYDAGFLYAENPDFYRSLTGVV